MSWWRVVRDHPNELARLLIRGMQVEHRDGIEVPEGCASVADTVIYADPPYVRADTSHYRAQASTTASPPRSLLRSAVSGCPTGWPELNAAGWHRHQLPPHDDRRSAARAQPLRHRMLVDRALAGSEPTGESHAFRGANRSPTSGPRRSTRKPLAGCQAAGKIASQPKPNALAGRARPSQ